MEPRYIFIIAITAISCATAIVITLINTWGRSRARKAALVPDESRFENQLQALQQSVDSIALEVERISEGQRFTTKLLSDRTGERVDAPR